MNHKFYVRILYLLDAYNVTNALQTHITSVVIINGIINATDNVYYNADDMLNAHNTM